MHLIYWLHWTESDKLNPLSFSLAHINSTCFSASVLIIINNKNQTEAVVTLPSISTCTFVGKSIIGCLCERVKRHWSVLWDECSDWMRTWVVWLAVVWRACAVIGCSWGMNVRERRPGRPVQEPDWGLRGLMWRCWADGGSSKQWVWARAESSAGPARTECCDTDHQHWLWTPSH